MVNDKCDHAEQWLGVYHSAVQSGYDKGYAEGFAAAQLSNDQFAELVSWKITDRAEQRTANADFSKMVIQMVKTGEERAKRGIR
ncbi:hypothetical protein [Brevibacterium zhoupengii]|uniref:hypothetical protein n=1 Tax=Brevibacterium zhoupengii TaxID=2898795 RepID=UPI001E3F9251|nr:hypothetical protein [Brevibacterium zhoupengii]